MSLSHVVLASGDSIDLAELRMSSTYGGVLEGYPCRRVNDMKIARLLRQAEAEYPRTAVHLVPPSLEHPDDGDGGSFGPVEVLPPVTCVGVFHGGVIDDDLDSFLYASSLTVIWFQHTLDVPSGDNADPALRAIAWERLARDHER